MPVALKVPAVGESISEITVGAWRRAEGDLVSADEPLVEVESDKATLEVPAPTAGVLVRILKQTGESARVGEAIGEIEPGARAPSPERSVAATPEPPTPPAPPAAGTPPAGQASPALRRLMQEGGLAPEDVRGTGKGGRIQKEDVERALGARPPAGGGRSAPDPAATALVGPGERERIVPMTTLRRAIARRLVEAQQTAAILTTFNEIDMSAVTELRKRYGERFQDRYGVKLGFMSFFVKAAIEALKAVPAVNGEVRGTDIVYKDHYDIGVAVGGGKGLVVPVVRDADLLSFAQLEEKIAALAARARDAKLTVDELQGGTFTISNGGVYGSLLSTPILNPPQSGILGLHAIQKRAVVVDDQIVIRPMMYVALSYDHRIVDGREAVQFLRHVKDDVEDPERILIEV